MLRFALFYALLLTGANPAMAVDPAALAALKTGEMKPLAVHSEPKPAGVAEFADREGGTHNLADWQGKVVLLNFWAVSCVPPASMRGPGSWPVRGDAELLPCR